MMAGRQTHRFQVLVLGVVLALVGASIFMTGYAIYEALRPAVESDFEKKETPSLNEQIIEPKSVSPRFEWQEIENSSLSNLLVMGAV